MAGLMDVARAVAGPAAAVRLAYGTAGDRTDEILHRLGVIAGGADDLVIAEKRHYLRGRDLERDERASCAPAPARAATPARSRPSPTELEALRALLERAQAGDVCAVMAHVERSELFDWLEERGLPAGRPWRGCASCIG